MLNEGQVKRMEALAREHMGRAVPPEVRRIEEEFKVPVAGSLWPGLIWIACVAVGKLAGEMPTDEEAAQVASYIDYTLATVYNEGFADQIRRLPLPLCGGHNTTIFVKHPMERADGGSFVGWGYRRTSWHTGSWPHTYQHRKDVKDLPGPLTLRQVLDKVCGWSDSPNPKWEAWKAARPEVFPAEVTV